MQESVEKVKVDPKAHAAAVTLIALPFAYMLRRHLWTSLKWMVAAWRRDPIWVVSRIITSFIVGQGIFWVIGYDQLSLGAVNPWFETGQFIRRVSANWAEQVPDKASWVWGIKAVEIATDAGKMPLEARVMLRHGFVSDGVAFMATQPAWSLVEAADKLAGAIQQPEYVRSRKGLQVSIACILGSLFRYVLAGLGLLFGKRVIRYIADPIERGLRKVLNRS